MLAFAARALAPIGVVTGMYIFWIGADHPGGKFQGGPSWRHVAAGHDGGLADAPPISRSWLRGLLVAGPLAFIGIGAVGAVQAGAFLAYPEGFAKPLILVIEFALMPSLTLILGLMLLGARSEQGAMNAGTLFGLCAAV